MAARSMVIRAAVVAEPAERRVVRPGRSVSFRAGAAATGFQRPGTRRRGDAGDAGGDRRAAFRAGGEARVQITGQIALADDEFATVVQGTVAGLIGSVVLITLWLFLAVRTWRLIVPILMTLVLGLMLTLLFASVAVGTLNVVSVGFGILFVGIAVDFAIQFSVRYRERAVGDRRSRRGAAPDRAAGRAADPGRRAGNRVPVSWPSCRRRSPAWRSWA